MNSTTQSICPACRHPKVAAAPEGLCPRCLALLAAGELAGAKPRPVDESLADQRSFADYELLEEAGRGGMGIVFKARQLGVKRVVALKILAGGEAAGREFVHRFHNEAAAAARLDHPNIVPVHEFGEHEGTYYLAMRFMEGGTLRARAAQTPFTPEESARITLQLADALEHAHRRGVLHRDLKPGNVLLDAEEAPRLADFGLARLAEDETDLTVSHAVLGTAAYMAPEVASGGSARATTASDVYGLGAILYELLAGRAPFAAESLAALLRKVSEEEPSAIGLFKPGIPRDLETICLKCLEKEPSKRYATARELAEELDRFLRHEPIQARPITPVERAWRWCRRKPALAGALATAVLFFIAGITGVLWQWREAQSNARAARKSATIADANAAAARRAQYASDMNLAHQAVQDGDFFRARQLLNRHDPTLGVPSSGGPGSAGIPAGAKGIDATLRGWEWRYLEGQTRRDDLGVLGQHTNLVLGLAVSPDGQRVASADFGGLLSMWDLASRTLITNRQFRAAVFANNDQLFAVTFSPDGHRLAVGGVNGKIHLLDPAMLAEIAVLPADLRVLSLAFSPDGRHLAAACTQGLQIWDFANHRKLAEFPFNHDLYETLGLAFSPDGRMLASSQDRQSVRLYDAASWREIRVLEQGAAIKRCIAFSPDGRWLATSSTNLKIWNVADWSLVATWTNRTSWTSALAFLPDGNALAHAGLDQEIHFRNTADWTEQASFKGDVSDIQALRFTPDGTSFITASERSLHVWPTRKSTPLPTSLPLPADVSPYWRLINLSPDARSAVMGLTNSTFKVWDLESFKPVGHHDLAPGETFVRNSQVDMVSNRDATLPPFYCTMTIDSARRLVALGDVNGRLALRSLDGSASNRLIHAHRGVVAMTTFSPDGRRLATAGWDGEVQVRDVRTGERGARHPGPVNAAIGLVFSPDGTWLAAGGWDGGLLIWKPDDTSLPPVLKAGGAAIRWLCFAPDNSRLFASGYEKRVQVWSLPEARLEREIPVRHHANLALSPDGERLVLAQSQQIRILETRDWQDVATLSMPDEMGHITAFQSSGATLIKVSSENIRRWRAAVPEAAMNSEINQRK